jgi:hypothetical protein
MVYVVKMYRFLALLSFYKDDPFLSPKRCWSMELPLA